VGNIRQVEESDKAEGGEWVLDGITLH